MNEQHLAGKTAFVAGWILVVPVVIPSTVQYLHLVHRGGGLLTLLPILGLLALYLIVGGAIQWKTGRGGIRLKPNPNLARFGIVVAVVTIALTTLLVVFSGPRT
ncbi:MAG: hypothetical protein ABI467_13100 [Kofleriaceae bacterium]